MVDSRRFSGRCELCFSDRSSTKGNEMQRSALSLFGTLQRALRRTVPTFAGSRPTWISSCRQRLDRRSRQPRSAALADGTERRICRSETAMKKCAHRKKPKALRLLHAGGVVRPNPSLGLQPCGKAARLPQGALRPDVIYSCTNRQLAIEFGRTNLAGKTMRLGLEALGRSRSIARD
jgi:hypothetical protein